MLQGAAIIELPDDEAFAFGAVPQRGLPGFVLVLLPDPAIAAGDPVPDAGETARQACGPFSCLSEPARFLRGALKILCGIEMVLMVRKYLSGVGGWTMILARPP